MPVKPHQPWPTNEKRSKQLTTGGTSITMQKLTKAKSRRTVVAILIAASLGAAALTTPSAALAFPTNPGIPAKPGTSSQFPGNPG
jgi:hypothetical protein